MIRISKESYTKYIWIYTYLPRDFTCINTAAAWLLNIIFKSQETT